jgi:hypothetical protein
VAATGIVIARRRWCDRNAARGNRRWPGSGGVRLPTLPDRLVLSDGNLLLTDILNRVVTLAEYRERGTRHFCTTKSQRVP